MKQFFVFLLLIATATTVNAQKKMVKIDIPVETIGVDATTLFVTADEAVVISQNNVEKYRVRHDGSLQPETQYFFILRVSPGCERCEVQDAEIVKFVKSVRQITREVYALKSQYLKTE